MGSKTKHTTTSFKDTSICSSAIADSAVTTGKINADAVTSAKISNATVTASDLASSLDLSSKTVTLSNTTFNSQFYNIGLLGFKMAVNESLTVFNLVDGVVDEFNDESGTDEAEGSNDLYNSTDDYYINSTTPDASPSSPGVSYSAGFSMTAITEPDTSTAGTNPSQAVATKGVFTVPNNVSSVSFKVWGAGGGGGGWSSEGGIDGGGGGGFTSGNVAVAPGQSLGIMAGEGGFGGFDGQTGLGGAFGSNPNQPQINAALGTSLNSLGGGFSTTLEWAGNNAYGGGGAGLAAITSDNSVIAFPYGAPQVPNVITVAGGGGGGGSPNLEGGAGGGLIGDAGNTTTEQTNQGPHPDYAGGGSQTQGGQGGDNPANPGRGLDGGLFYGGDATSGTAGGGAGYYGGGGSSYTPGSGPGHGAGGGGSSYYGHPQVTCGSTEEGSSQTGGGTADPNYQAGTNEGGPASAPRNGEDGYVLITATELLTATATSTTIVSDTFTSTSVPTNSRIVVFEENVDTPTLNTDIIASVSRDGTNFTNATLSDSGYVTGSSGQRILTGQADISGQPSGQSMRWKLQLANNQVKIHGVSLSWA